MTAFTPDHHSSIEISCNLLLGYTYALLHKDVKDMRLLGMVACDREVEFVRRLHGLVPTRLRRNMTYELRARNA